MWRPISYFSTRFIIYNFADDQVLDILWGLNIVDVKILGFREDLILRLAKSTAYFELEKYFNSILSSFYANNPKYFSLKFNFGDDDDEI